MGLSFGSSFVLVMELIFELIFWLVFAIVVFIRFVVQFFSFFVKPSDISGVGGNDVSGGSVCDSVCGSDVSRVSF